MMDLIETSAALAAITMLLSRSKLFGPVRNRLPSWLPIHCPVCLSFWAAAPYLFPIMDYFTLVTFTNVWMLLIAKLYLAIGDMDYEE